jgi:hypothetical protein
VVDKKRVFFDVEVEYLVRSRGVTIAHSGRVTVCVSGDAGAIEVLLSDLGYTNEDLVDGTVRYE